MCPRNDVSEMSFLLPKRKIHERKREEARGKERKWEEGREIERKVENSVCHLNNFPIAKMCIQQPQAWSTHIRMKFMKRAFCSSAVFFSSPCECESPSVVINLISGQYLLANFGLSDHQIRLEMILMLLAMLISPISWLPRLSRLYLISMLPAPLLVRNDKLPIPVRSSTF